MSVDGSGLYAYIISCRDPQRALRTMCQFNIVRHNIHGIKYKGGWLLSSLHHNDVVTKLGLYQG